MPLPLLPPAFALVVLDAGRDAFARACEMTSASPNAAEAVADGAYVWTDDARRLDVAVVLEPEAGTAETLPAFWVWAAAALDALDALLPPMLEVRLAGPDRLLLNGAIAGRLRCAWGAPVPPSPIPPWLVLGLSLDLVETRAEPGLDPERTTLESEGAGEVGSAELAEAVARWFLARMHEWQEDGFAPIADHLNARLAPAPEAGHRRLAGRPSAAVRGIDRHGRLVTTGGAVPLNEVLDGLGGTS